MKKIVLGAAAALALAAAALAPSAASAGWKGHHGGWHHGHGGWGGPKIIVGGGYGYSCPRVPVTVWTAYGPVVKFVRSCRGFY